MQNSPNEDNDSVHSDDSVISVSAQKEKLDGLVNMEMKHSGVYRDIFFKDNLLKVDLENLYHTCQRLDSQTKKKSEQLDDLYDKLADEQKKKKAQLDKELSSILQEFAEINTSFCEGFDVYSYDVCKDTHEYLENGRNKEEENYLGASEYISAFQQRMELNNFMIKNKPAQLSDIKNSVNALIEISMRRPEIELKEANAKLMQEIRKSQQLLEH